MAVPPPRPPDPPLALESVILPAWSAAGQVLTLRGLAVTEVVVRCVNGRECVFRFAPAAEPAAGPRRKARETELGAAVLAALAAAGKPLKQAELARRMSANCSGHFKQTCSDLVKDGDLVVLPDDGYWFPDRPAHPPV
jgi:hypothetical protein